MLTSKPHRARVIDFNRVMSRDELTLGHVKGTPGYFPVRDDWRDGSTKWDIWSLVAIILECDMKVGIFKTADDEQHSLYFARNHIKEKGVSKPLIKLVEDVMISRKKEPNVDLKTIIKAVEKMKFMEY